MKKIILQFIFVFIVGGLAGIIFNVFLVPYLASLSFFSNVDFLYNSFSGTTIINPTERVIIKESQATEDAIEKNLNKVVVIESYKDGKVLTEGTGFILTGDGLLVTSNNLIPKRADSYKVLYQNEYTEAEVNKRDLENNLALLSVDKEDLPIFSFAEIEKIRLGEEIILLAGKKNKSEENSFFVNLGVIRSFSKDQIETNLKESNQKANGAPLVNIKGEAVGLALINDQGLVGVIGIDKIRSILNN